MLSWDIMSHQKHSFTHIAPAMKMLQHMYLNLNYVQNVIQSIIPIISSKSSPIHISDMSSTQLLNSIV